MTDVSSDAFLRKLIDLVWGEALQDDSVPSPRMQDRMIERARAEVGASPQIAGSNWWDETPWEELHSFAKVAMSRANYEKWIKRPDVIDRMAREP